MERKKRAVLITTIIVALILFVVFDIFNVLLYSAYEFAKTHGMSTRVFLFFLGDDTSVSLDSGRGTIIYSLIQAIGNNPLGSGLASDRYYSGGHYAHNIIIELLVEFGVIFGAAIIIMLFALMFRAAKYTHNNWNTGIIFYMLICCGFVKLLISGSYLTEPYFWTLFGFIMGISEMLTRNQSDRIGKNKYIRN